MERLVNSRVSVAMLLVRELSSKVNARILTKLEFVGFVMEKVQLSLSKMLGVSVVFLTTGLWKVREK